MTDNSPAKLNQNIYTETDESHRPNEVSSISFTNTFFNQEANSKIKLAKVSPYVNDSIEVKILQMKQMEDLESAY